MAYARGYSRLERMLVKFPKPNYLLPYYIRKFWFITPRPRFFFFQVVFRLTESVELRFMLRQLLDGLILKSSWTRNRVLSFFYS